MSIRRHSSNLYDVSEYFLFSSPTEPCGPDRLTNSYGPFYFELESKEQVDLFKLPTDNNYPLARSDQAADDSHEDDQPVLALVKKRSSFKVELILEEFSLGDCEKDRPEMEGSSIASQFVEELKNNRMISSDLQRSECPRFKPISKCSRISSISTAILSNCGSDVELPLTQEVRLRRQLRKEKVERYLAKKKSRIWNRKISYDCRKRFADTRVRVRGRFVTKVEEEVLMRLPEDNQQQYCRPPSNRSIELDRLLY